MSNNNPSVPLAPKAVDHTFRRKWNKAEYDAKAVELGVTSVHNAALAVDNSADVGKPTVTFEQDRGTANARNTSLNLEQQVGIRAEVADARTAGFYCSACDRAEKDSSAWLDHLNSVQHQKNAGAVLSAERSTVDEVHARLRELKRKHLHALANDDDARDPASLLDETEFEARLERLRQTDEERLAEKRAKKRAKKKALKKALRAGGGTDTAAAAAAAADTTQPEEQDSDGDGDASAADEQPPAAEEAAVVDDEEAAMAAMLGLPTGFSSKRK
jgi:hypothetical protein